jgi:hypothetical protein
MAIVIAAVSAALIGDWLAFFDHDAFADNPRWSSCYCCFHLAPHTTQGWRERSAADNRAAVAVLIPSVRMRD